MKRICLEQSLSAPDPFYNREHVSAKPIKYLQRTEHRQQTETLCCFCRHIQRSFLPICIPLQQEALSTVSYEKAHLHLALMPLCFNCFKGEVCKPVTPPRTSPGAESLTEKNSDTGGLRKHLFWGTPSTPAWALFKMHLSRTKLAIQNSGSKNKEEFLDYSF